MKGFEYWDRTTADIGTVEAGKPYEVRFHYAGPKKITKVSVGCGSCTQAVWDKKNKDIVAIYTPSVGPKSGTKVTKKVTATFEDGVFQNLEIVSTYA